MKYFLLYYNAYTYLMLTFSKNPNLLSFKQRTSETYPWFYTLITEFIAKTTLQHLSLKLQQV